MFNTRVLRAVCASCVLPIPSASVLGLCFCQGHPAVHASVKATWLCPYPARMHPTVVKDSLALCVTRVLQKGKQ